VGGVGDGISGNKVVSAVADGGGSSRWVTSPYASAVAMLIALREAKRMVVRLETCQLLAGVGMESRWESKNMAVDLRGSESSGTEGAKWVMPRRPPSGSARSP
jgi:hypothetical protein